VGFGGAASRATSARARWTEAIGRRRRRALASARSTTAGSAAPARASRAAAAIRASNPAVFGSRPAATCARASARIEASARSSCASGWGEVVTKLDRHVAGSLFPSMHAERGCGDETTGVGRTIVSACSGPGASARTAPARGRPVPGRAAEDLEANGAESWIAKAVRHHFAFETVWDTLDERHASRNTNARCDSRSASMGQWRRSTSGTSLKKWSRC